MIGTRWGLVHVGAFREAGAEIAAIRGADPGRTRRIADAERIPLAAESVDHLIEACEIVVVAGPPDLHGEHARAALQAGRAVLVEKPLARRVSDARTLAGHAAAAGRPSATSFAARYLDPLRRLRDAVRAEGALEEASFEVDHGFGREPEEPDARGPSAEFMGASHGVDLARWVLGDDLRFLDATRPEGPGSGVILEVATAAGAPVRIAQCARPMSGSWGCWRVRTRGTWWQVEGGYVPDRGGWVVTALRRNGVATGPGAEPLPDPWYRAHVEQARAFLGLLHDRPRGDLATLDDGYRATALLAAAAQRLESRAPAAPADPGSSVFPEGRDTAKADRHDDAQPNIMVLTEQVHES